MYEFVKMDSDEEYNPQYIIEVEVQKIINRTSRFLDCFIEFMKQESPDILRETLTRFRNKLTQFEHTSLDPTSYEYTPSNFEFFPDVFEHIRAVSLSLLKYNDHIATEKDGKISVPYWNLVSSSEISLYILGESLIDTIPREQAIALFKRSIDFETDKTAKRDETITCIEDFQKAAFSTATPTHTGVMFLTSNGVLGSKTTRCMWADIFSKFPDSELAYAVACHYDFNAARYINKNFRLTRTKTLIQGDEFCDFCWHDISIDTEMKHPPEEFWKDLDDLVKNGSRQ